jgi:pyruvate dehydrogenase E2 component (dihydrolipoamide acetyltransferase)
VIDAKPTSKSSAPATLQSTSQQVITESRRIPVSGMRSVIANRLVESKNTIPHFYVEMDIDCAPLIKLRENINNALASLDADKGGIKISVNDLILKASAEALRRVPQVNVSWMGDHIIQHGSIHIAFGVAIDDGLVTPVIRDAHTKSLRTISNEAKDYITKARNKKLKPDEMSGSTFTVSNLGMYGVKNFFGIINPPNAGILSVSSPTKIPVVDANGNIVAGQRMSLGFSGDHRVVDGAIGASFLKALKDILETPEVMLV